MKTVYTPAMVMCALCVGFLAYLDYSARFMPLRMAVHFGVNGQANGWMDRSTNLMAFAAAGVGVPLLFGLLSLALKSLPARLMNIPHRDYWLSRERKTATSNYICGGMLWMACLLILFMAGMNYLVIRANESRPPHLPANLFMTALAAFLAAAGLWCFMFVRHFYRKPR